jgi:hypothetical protein
MPDLPLQPALVHVPLGLAFVVPLVAVGVAVAFRRGRLPRAAFALVAALQLLLAGSSVAALLAGQRDERRVERIVGRHPVHEHLERAEAFVWAACGVAALGVALVLVPVRALGVFTTLTVAGTFGVAALAFVTGVAGGQIVYRHGGAAAYATPAVAVPPARGDRADDDD